MRSDHYAAFIDEAFIKPIRSVLIVDDDYPTMDDMFRGGPSGDKRYNPGQVRAVIESFRRAERGYIVDIHDASNVNLGEEAHHLHQSDLLVLDYELDRTRRGDGAIAIKIISRLMRNNHLNLVIVHTSEDLANVFQNILRATLARQGLSQTAKEARKAERHVTAAIDDEPDIGRELDASVGVTQYLHYRRNGMNAAKAAARSSQAPFTDFAGLCERLGWKPDVQAAILVYLIVKVDKEFKTVEEGGSDDLSWSGDEPRWIQSRSLFLALSRKKKEGGDLMAELAEALRHWGPDPSRLFLARLRAELDEQGTLAQQEVLGNKHALAHWYHTLLASDDEAQGALVAETVSRHSEQLMAKIVDSVSAFANRLVNAEKASGEAETSCLRHFGIDLGEPGLKLEAQAAHNAVVNSLDEPCGWHLTTGHVFRLDGDLWVCASPACDMVPNQQNSFKVKAYKDRTPFLAVRLQPVARIEEGIREALSSRVLFLRIDGEVRSFCINTLGQIGSAPTWTQFYAESRGRFLEGARDFDVSRVELDGGGTLAAARHRASVVAQLRYEYALNIVQRLGVSVTRIGLDFAGGEGSG